MQLFAPAAERNKSAIWRVLQESVLPSLGTILEVASGSGQHILHFARQAPHLQWQPSDPDAAARSSIDAYVGAAGLSNVAPALPIDATTETWPAVTPVGIININMIHISPWAACLGLLRQAARLLPVGTPAGASGGFLYFYGPFFNDDHPPAPSNLDFDGMLRSQNPGWGVRRLPDVVAAALACGLHLERVVAMPAHNLSVVFRR